MKSIKPLNFKIPLINYQIIKPHYMKMKLRILLLVISMMSLLSLSAQNSDSPWQVYIGFNFVDLYPTGADENAPFGPQGKFLEDPFNFSEHWNFGGPTISLSRSIFKGFSIGVDYSMSIIKKIEGNSLGNYNYYAASLNLKQTFNTSRKINPFINVGYGISDISYKNFKLYSKNGSNTLRAGFGFEIKLSDRGGFSINTNYLHTLESTGVRHFRHQAGMYYLFGGKDSDKDGVPDKKDACPDQAGLAEFSGCPDTDGDGIPDSQDNCPDEAGSAEMNGCPDQDADGVTDKDDACPDQAGLAEFNGCPDSDGDSVIDGEDKCPEQSGDPQNQGCPWTDTDGDSVTDNIDACPDQPGTVENSGCPELSSKVVTSINELSTQINFAAGSSKIQGKIVKDTLDEIKNLLDENPKGNLIIEGHTSSDGDDEKNLILSKERAKAVKEYLIGIGVDPDRLRTEGYGEERPLSDNDTMEGRILNRRVQFRAEF